MFSQIFVIFLIFGSSCCAVVNIPDIIEAFAIATPQFIQNYQNMNNGLNTMAHGTTFAQMAETLQQTMDLIGSGYDGNSNLFKTIVQSFQSNAGSTLGDIAVPDQLMNDIVNGLNGIAAGWATVYGVNTLVGKIVENNANILMNMDNPLPSSLTNGFVTAEKPMVSGFHNMAINSQLVGDALSKLAAYTSGQQATKLKLIALNFYNNVTPLNQSSLALRQADQTLSNLSAPTVLSFLTTFNVELTSLGIPYTQYVTNAQALNNALSNTSSSL